MIVTLSLKRATQVAGTVTDPEMPMLTLRDLGVLRDVVFDGERLIVTITPTYSGCPALATMRADLTHRLKEDGFDDVSVNIVLEPAWSTDWITNSGRQKLSDHGISPPEPARRHSGPIPLTLVAPSRRTTCPHCASRHTEIVSEFGATPCKALCRCLDCCEPFEHVKTI